MKTETVAAWEIRVGDKAGLVDPPRILAVTAIQYAGDDVIITFDGEPPKTFKNAHRFTVLPRRLKRAQRAADRAAEEMGRNLNAD